MSLPGLKGTDHIGFTVPDLEEADHFFVEVLGCERFYSLGPYRSEDDWMTSHLGVHPRAEIEELRFFRCGNGTNFEVFKYISPDGQQPQPANSDIGGHHIALYVEDIDLAVAHLRHHDIEVMGEPTASRGPAQGQRWVYFKAPWGMQFELVSYPGGKAYEQTAATLLWHPEHPAR